MCSLDDAAFTAAFAALGYHNPDGPGGARGVKSSKKAGTPAKAASQKADADSQGKPGTSVGEQGSPPPRVQSLQLLARLLARVANMQVTAAPVLQCGLLMCLPTRYTCRRPLAGASACLRVAYSSCWPLSCSCGLIQLAACWPLTWRYRPFQAQHRAVTASWRRAHTPLPAGGSCGAAGRIPGGELDAEVQRPGCPGRGAGGVPQGRRGRHTDASGRLGSSQPPAQPRCRPPAVWPAAAKGTQLPFPLRR